MRQRIAKILLVCMVFISTTMLVNYVTLQIDVSNSKQYNVLIEGVGQTINFFGPMQSKWIGSGVVISSDGLILTAKHCVEGAEFIQITLQDGRSYRITTWYKDKDYDVALIQLPDVNNIKYASFGDSNDLTKGDKVYTIGEAGGIWDNTVTFGEIHKIHFKRLALGENSEFIFVNTSIAHGCSGGGLYRDRFLVGIVVMGSEDGATWCVPINIIKVILKDYKETDSSN